MGTLGIERGSMTFEEAIKFLKTVDLSKEPPQELVDYINKITSSEEVVSALKTVCKVYLLPYENADHKVCEHLIELLGTTNSINYIQGFLLGYLMFAKHNLKIEEPEERPISFKNPRFFNPSNN